MKEQNKISSRSIVQGIVTSERVKTPKSLLLPSVIKTLTNNTEVKNILSSLTYGVSYSILSEMYTKNAYLIQKQQSDEVVLPINTAKEVFTIYVADDIDRNEVSLTG